MKAVASSLAIAFLAIANLAFGQQPMSDPARINVFVTPYYDSEGPSINAGPFSKGLTASGEADFVATVSMMKQSWNSLTFPEIYVGAIRLYDLGFRNEAVYWFYSAQYRGRLFALLLEEGKVGSIGNRGFELAQAANAFQQLVGPYINGYAFGHITDLVSIIERVQKEGKVIPELDRVYPGVSFKSRSQWEARNRELNEGMGGLLAMLKEQNDIIKQQRVENGTEAAFSKLVNKELLKRSGH
jgi:hypothetical protein